MTLTTSPGSSLPASSALGTVLHSLLWQAKVSQTAAGKALGKQPPTMGKKLRGEVPFTVDELVILADLVGIEPAELLRRSTESM